jgi:hypothetical protein
MGASCLVVSKPKFCPHFSFYHAATRFELGRRDSKTIPAESVMDEIEFNQDSVSFKIMDL